MSLIIANWKMYFTLNEATKFCNKLEALTHPNELIIAAPTPYLGLLAAQYTKLKFAAQNLSYFQNFGAYTGEYSAKMIKSCNIDYAIIGHSERRKLFKETRQIIFNKLLNVLEADLVPIICLEALQHDNNTSFNVHNLKKQLINLINSLNNFPDREFIIAYEPSYAIGTGIPSSFKLLHEIFAFIKEIFSKSKLEKNVKLVYGGSVNQENIANILIIPNIDGVLVGNCSTNEQNFIEIIKKDYQ